MLRDANDEMRCETIHVKNVMHDRLHTTCIVLNLHEAICVFTCINQLHTTFYSTLKIH